MHFVQNKEMDVGGLVKGLFAYLPINNTCFFGRYLVVCVQ